MFSRNKGRVWTTYLLISVDDLILSFGDKEDHDEIVHNLNQDVEVKQLGDITQYFGIHTEREDLSSQPETQDCRAVGSSGLEGSQRSEHSYGGKLFENNELLPDHTQYRETTGNVLYINMLTQTYIASAMEIQCRKTSLPSKRDWITMKQLGGDLKG